HPGAAGGFEYGDRPPRVHALRVLWRSMNVIHIRDRRQMRHRVAGMKRALERFTVGDRAQHGLDAAVLMPRRGPQVVDHGLVAARAQLVDYVRSDEAGSACNENP